MTPDRPAQLIKPHKPGQYAVVGELAELIAESGQVVAVIAVHIEPDCALYRLSLESSQKLQREIGLRLIGNVRPSDRVHAVDDATWLLLLPGIASPAVPQLAMLKVSQALSDPPLTLDGIDLHLQLNCGAAMSPTHGDDALHLIQSARIAAIAARNQGGGYAIFDPAMDLATPQQVALETELRKAIGRSQGLDIHLQPKIAISSGRCDSAEALLRWTRSSGEKVPPPVAIAAVERMGLRRQFNHWLLQRCARTAKRLAEKNLDIQVSVNLSASDFLDPETPDLIAQALSTWQLSGSALRVECTETGFIEEGEASGQIMKRLEALGVSLAIDDFGTGFASMTRLQKMAVQEVKIDRSFVTDLGHSIRDREIVTSIIDLSSRLGISVTAEGVEDLETAQILTAMGCHHLQGYLFARALPPDEFLDWVIAHNSKA